MQHARHHYGPYTFFSADTCCVTQWTALPLRGIARRGAWTTVRSGITACHVSSPAIMLLGSKCREDETAIAEIAVGIGATTDVLRT